MKLKPSIDGMICGEATKVVFSESGAAVGAPHQLVVQFATPSGGKHISGKSAWAFDLSRYGVQIDVDALPRSAR